jgi:transposase InsO family protein
MDKNEKNNATAIFRFGVISDFVIGSRLNYGEKEKLLNEKAARKYKIPFSNRTSVARTTIEEWIADYKNAGFRFEGLFPKERSDKGVVKTLTEEQKTAIKDLRKANSKLTVPTILKILKAKKIIESDSQINTSSIYRFLKDESLVKINEDAKDKRQFEAEHPNELWQSDVMHGPHVLVNGKLRKTYLIAIIDDFSRYIINASFYLNEKRESFLDCLKTSVMRRGLSKKLYVDNGSCFKALHLDQITAQLGIAIHHSRPYIPQGRGKIERWFQHVRDGFLQVFKETHPQATFEDLNEQLENWVEEYNNKEHSSISMTPQKRYQDNIECTRPAPPDLINYFRQIDFRRVKKDRTIKLKGISYEVPVKLIDRKIELRYFPEDLSKVEVFFENKSFGFSKPVNVHVNSQIGRNWDSTKKVIKENTSTIIEAKNIAKSGLLSFRKDDET